MTSRIRSRSFAALIAVSAVVPAVVLTRSSETSEPTITAPRSGNTEAGTSVVWIVLDEAPLYALLKTDGNINAERFPGFAELAKNSTWYRNTLTTAQRTTEAVPAMLDGTWPTLRNYPVFADHPINLFTLSEGHKKLDVYQSITSLCPDNLCPNKIPDEERAADYQVSEFKDLTKRVSTSTEATVHFSHMLLPHRPWRLSADFRLAKELGVDPRPSTVVDRRRDSYQALLRQFVATDALLKDFITTLKDSNNWNRTMVIVTTDHGMTFVPGESFRDTVNPENPDTLEDIYRVPLFIKYPNQQTSVVSDCALSSIDILPTVLEVAGIPHDETFDGVDVSARCPLRTSRRVQWPYTGVDLTTDFSAVVDRVQFYNTWVDANGSVDDVHRVGRSGVLIGTRTPTDEQVLAGVSWTNVDPDGFKNIGDSPMSYAPSRVSGRIVATEPLCAQCEGLLVVDGEIVGSIPEIAGLKPSDKPAYFTTSVRTTNITSSSGPGELWIADWSSPTVTLRRVGPSR